MESQARPTSETPHAAHAAERPVYDDVSTMGLAMVGIVSLILTWLTVVLLEGVALHVQQRMVQQRSYDVPNARSLRAVEAQQQRLAEDPATGRRSIEQAMAETVQRYAAAPSSGVE